MLLQVLLLLIILYSSFRAFPKNSFRFFSCLCGPFVRLYIYRRIARNLEDKERINERFGLPSQKRPEGKLIWIHAVSVGETLSMIPIIDEIKKENPAITILLTTTTLTAAKQVEQRLSGKVIHQFVPFDIFMWVRRFIKYWKPSIAIFVESEIWPNVLYYLHEKDIATYLFNARMSDKSLKRMNFVKNCFGILPYSLYTEIFISSQDLKNTVRDFGGRDIRVVPNLKMISEKLPVDEKRKKDLEKIIADRKTWIAVSTHPGEEEIILETHKKIKRKVPDVLTVIAVRHPARKEELKALAEANGVSSIAYSDLKKRRSGIKDDLLILDEIGRLGEFFSVIDTVLVCGSLVPGIGGHNFLEPLKFACNVATGSFMDNFKDVYSNVEKYCKIANKPEEIAEFVLDSFKSFTRKQALPKEMDCGKEWQRVIKEILKR